MNSVPAPRFDFESVSYETEGSKRVRTAWISDVHLGTRASGAARLLDFLREYDFGTLYIVGDLIDIWQMRRSRYWPQQHNDLIQKILRKSRKGTRVIYIPGNHDEMISSFTAPMATSLFKNMPFIERRMVVAFSLSTDMSSTPWCKT